MNKRYSPNRRTFLRASGVAVALPLLESIGPRALAAAPVRRMVNICCTLGLYKDSWMPTTTGADYAATEYLEIINAHRDRYTLFSGLSHEEQTGRQAHNSEITWLTSTRHPGLDGFQNTISIDQAAANHLGYTTRFPSFVLGTATPQSQSYTDNGVMVPAETSPAALFKKLFIKGTPEEIARETQRLADGGSVLDNLKSQAARQSRSASAPDAEKLEAYFEAVRRAERELAEVAKWTDKPKPQVNEVPPIDVPDKADLIGRVRLLFKLIPLILQTDSSRVVNVMIQDHGVVPQVPGVTSDLHSLSHHGQDAAKITQLRTVEKELVRLFGDLMTELTATSDAQGPLIDQTAVLFGSNLGNASSHAAKDLPILVAGGGFAHGKHIAHEGGHDDPLCNLFVTLLRSMGMEVDAFGQSTGALRWS
jgi:hypothetical protein